MKIAGIILAGGKSSRYGKPKMFEMYKSKYFYQHSVDALKDNSIFPVIISTNLDLLYTFPQIDHTDFFIEQETYQGPLSAIHNVALTIPDVDWFFVLSCDIPFVSSAFVHELLGKIDKYDNHYDAIVPYQSNKAQPLMALYHRRILKKFEYLLLSGEKKMHVLLNNINVKRIDFSEKEKAFTNINYHQEFLNILNNQKK
ncbi:MAG: molybdenum cofactor guanylyltransferase [Bacillus sp. (in: firmicutes)]